MFLKRRKTGSAMDERIGRILAGELKEPAVAGACPDAEQIAALIDGGLSGAERDIVLSHLSGCGDCRELLVTAVKLSEDESTARAASQGWRPALLVPYAAAAVLLLAVVSVALIYRQAPLSPKGESVALNYAKQEKRTDDEESVPESFGGKAAAPAPPVGESSAKEKPDSDNKVPGRYSATVPEEPLSENKSAGSDTRFYDMPAMRELPEMKSQGIPPGYRGGTPGIMPMSDMPERLGRTAVAEGFADDKMRAEEQPVAPSEMAMTEPAPTVDNYEPQMLAKAAAPPPPVQGSKETVMTAPPPPPRAETPLKELAASPAPDAPKTKRTAECEPDAGTGTLVCKLPEDDNNSASAGGVRAMAAPNAAQAPEAEAREIVEAAKPAAVGELVKERGTIKSIDLDKGEIEFTPKNGKETITILVDKELLKGFEPGDNVMAQYVKGKLNVARRIKKIKPSVAVGC